MLQNMIRRMQARVMVVATDDSGMSTVEYANVGLLCPMT